MSNFPPTAEQEAIIEAARDGKNVLVEAGAGTGKTSTLVLLAEDRPAERFSYIAYNKAIQVDASKRFPQNTDVRTAHSLAYREIVTKNRNYQQRLKGNRVPARQVAAILGIKAPLTLKDTKGEDHVLNQTTLARIAMATVTRFCQSADQEIAGWMVPKQDGVEADHGKLVAYILPLAQAAWSDLTSDHGNLKFDHAHYLKLYQLSQPKINASVILYDEAQDANPVIQSIIMSQTHAQIICVGDRAQAIYGWNGAVDAMQTFEADHHLMLTQSFRFGPAIADEANKYLNLIETPLRLTGFTKIHSVVEPTEDAKAILCRTNAGVIEVAMSIQANGKQAAIVGGAAHIEAYADAADNLMQGQHTEHPELAAFRHWTEVQAYSQEDEGADLRSIVRLIDNYGTKALREVARNSVKEEQADVIVSTAHKAKGREWDTVRIHSDFAPPKQGGAPSTAELMLMYVSVTRAKVHLDTQALTWVFEQPIGA